MNNIKHITDAQDQFIDVVLSELRSGKKLTHWIWFIFPQLKALGSSENALKYGVEDIAHANELMSSAKFVYNMLMSLHAIQLAIDDLNITIVDIMGEVDAMKLKSSLTLFSHSTNDVRYDFDEKLKDWFGGERCNLTIEHLT